MPSPDIQKQFRFRSLATAAALEWKRLTDAGDLKAAKKQALEAVRLEKEWRRHGGIGDLFG